LEAEWRNIVVPYQALLCKDVLCHSAVHTTMLSHYTFQISQACLNSAKDTVPVTKPCGVALPGWCEFVAPFKKQSLFWHNTCIDCGKPHSLYEYVYLPQRQNTPKNKYKKHIQKNTQYANKER